MIVPETTPTCWRFGPFDLDSEIDLSGMRLRPCGGGISVAVRIGLAGSRLLGPELPNGVCAAPADALLAVPGVARFLVQDGCRVTVEPEPAASPVDLRSYLTGWVFGALCHQNGLLPLHAATLERDGVTLAIAGDSGAGKSTLAAFLARRGYTVLSDDICLLEPGSGGPVIHPVAGWIKLWRGSLEALGQPADEADRTFLDEDKYRVYLPGERPRGLLLRHLFFLERTPAGDTPALRTLGTAAALARMLDTLYLAYLPALMQTERRVFAQCAQVLAHTRAGMLAAPWSWEAMAAVADLIEETIRQGIPEPAQGGVQNDISR